MIIKIRKGDIEIRYEEPQIAAQHPRALSNEAINELSLKLIEKLTEQVLKLSNESNNQNT